MTSDRLKQGRRVICQAVGPHKGKRGNVVEVVGEMAHVEFEATSMWRKRSYFQPIGEPDEEAVVE